MTIYVDWSDKTNLSLIPVLKTNALTLEMIDRVRASDDEDKKEIIEGFSRNLQAGKLWDMTCLKPFWTGKQSEESIRLSGPGYSQNNDLHPLGSRVKEHQYGMTEFVQLLMDQPIEIRYDINVMCHLVRSLCVHNVTTKEENTLLSQNNQDYERCGIKLVVVEEREGIENTNYIPLTEPPASLEKFFR